MSAERIVKKARIHYKALWREEQSLTEQLFRAATERDQRIAALDDERKALSLRAETATEGRRLAQEAAFWCLVAALTEACWIIYLLRVR